MESFAEDIRHQTPVPFNDAHLAAIREVSTEVEWLKGYVVIKPGDPLNTFVYLLEGSIEVFNLQTGEAYLEAYLSAGQFTGEIGFLTQAAATAALRVRENCRVLLTPRPEMLQLMSRIPELSDNIISAFASRRHRQVMFKDGSLILVGAEQDKAVRKVESFLSRNKIAYDAIPLDAPAAKVWCGDNVKPGLFFGDGAQIENPSIEQIAKLLGLDQAAVSGTRVDVLIAGGGPAGVAAAVYAGAEGLSSILVEELAVGGQAGTSSRIENYLGFPTGISGGDLIWRGEVQAMKFGTQFVLPRRVEALQKEASGRFTATLNDGTSFDAAAVVVATGVQYRRLPWKRLEDFEGAGVYYAATENEARLCAGEEVIIVGGGNSAGQAAMYLSRTAKHVHLMVRSDSLASSMSEYLTNRLDADPAITIHYKAQIESLEGNNVLSQVTCQIKGQQQTIPACGVFVMVGAAPNTKWLSELITLDNKGFVVTGESCGGRSQYETSVNGIFAVGDVRAGSVKRVASSVGEGSVVISDVWNHVNSE